MTVTLSLSEIEILASNTLQAVGASEKNALSVAKSIKLAEQDGITSHGLIYLPIYAQHVVCGKVDGKAKPSAKQTKGSAICVDAKNGFAHPAIDAGWQLLCQAASENGIAAMTVYNSYNCGVLGHHAERLTENHLIGLCFTHAPASIAPMGGATPVIGTNPFALAVPDNSGNAVFVIDQSASVIAKSEIALRARENRPIEANWALDKNGQATTNASDALLGSMLPSGGQKGFGVGLLAEVLAACLSGANLSTQASPFSGTAGGPPGTGQCFIAIDPNAFCAGLFQQQITTLTDSICQQENARLPGSKRQKNREKIIKNGVKVDESLLEKIKQIK